MTRWSVSIVGNPGTLVQLQEFFGGPDLEFSFEDGVCWLKSPQFDELQDAGEVLQAATALLHLVNGASRLALSPLERVSIGTVARHDSGQRKFYGSVTASASTHVALPASAIVRELGPSGFAVPAGWLSTALRNEGVAKVLRLLNKPEDRWDDLSRVLEVVQSDVGQRIVSEGWASQNLIDLFTHTANSAAAIGDAARHGSDRTPPPHAPMTHPEAVKLIHHIARRWILSKPGPDPLLGQGSSDAH